MVVIRHPKERISKCSLQPLHGRSDVAFYRAREGFCFDATGFILLAMDAPELSEEDGEHSLLLLDSTWRLLPQVEACVIGTPLRRTLPAGFQTAYPRISKIAEDPTGGLASVEALYLARRMMGHNDLSLLDGYYWRDRFLEINHL